MRIVSHLLRLRFRTWARRYLAAEIFGELLGVLAAILVHTFTGQFIIAGIAGTWSENLGYYGWIVTKDFLRERRVIRGQNFSHHVVGYVRTIRNLVVEFGPSEILDSFVVRPGYMSILPHFVHNFPLAIFIAGWLANLTFYLPTIIAYELRKRYL